MIIEDNIIIAMEAEHILLSFGAARCHVGGSVAAGLKIIREAEPTFALLDVNLGSENAEPIALLLKQRGIPFIVASGYGEIDLRLGTLALAPCVTKPYSRSQLAAAIALSLANRA